MWTLLGMLWAIPTPLVFQSIPYLNWSTIFALLCMVFYFTLSLKISIVMILQTIVMLAVVSRWETITGLALAPSMAIIFAICWVFQFYGHKVEGKKPSFFKDLFFLLIGPLWVTVWGLEKVGLHLRAKTA